MTHIRSDRGRPAGRAARDDWRQRQLYAALLGPPEPELTCDECFEQLDRYVEVALAGADPDRAVPGMAAHLVGCPACGDDHDSLLAYVRHVGEHASPPPPA
jgi:hypothetical protein